MVRIGSYTILKQLSEGSFGRTYLGEHHSLGIKACLKQEKTGDPLYQKLFRTEAMLLAKLHHESLPAFRDYYEDPSDPLIGQIIVMSFIEGKTITQIVQNDGAVADEHIAWILQRLLRVLGYMHYYGVVHSDIKPDNVILRPEEHHAVLVDFGLCAVRPDAHTLPMGGTEHYIAPEYLGGSPPSPSGDIYSLGKVGIYLAGGNVATGQLPDDMNDAMKKFLLRLTKRDPDARPKNAWSAQDQLVRVREEAFGRTESTEVFRHRASK